MRKLSILAVIVLATGLATGALIWSDSRTAQAARPSVTLAELGLSVAVDCERTSHLLWYATKFAHKGGFVRFFLYDASSGELVETGELIKIPKKTVPTAAEPREESQDWAGKDPGFYKTVVFYTTRGKDGAVLGREVESWQSGFVSGCP